MKTVLEEQPGRTRSLREMSEEIKVDRDIVRTVIDLRGDKQLGMVIEECSELIQATSKYQRLAIGDLYLDPEKIRENLVEEIADVYVTLQTARDLLDISVREINGVIQVKQARLLKRIEQGLITSQ